MKHLYYDVSDLNAPYDSIPMRGLGGGILSTGSLGSLGQSPSDYPWKEYSKSTAALQSEINAWLKSKGYCPISADGELGPTTCGAAVYYRDHSGFGGAANIAGGVPGTCQSFSFSPKSPPCPGAAAPGPAPTPPTTDVPATPSTARISSGDDWTWIAIGGLVAVGAVAAAVYYKKKRR